MNSSFTLRVYGLLISDDRILIAREVYNGRPMVKFPGGGLEYGESTVDCIRREFLEEMDLEVEIVRHYYTTDFFVASAFHEKTQVMSIYYEVSVTDAASVPVSAERLHDQGTHFFEWIPFDELDPEIFSFPIDRHVAVLLKAEKANRQK